MEEDGICYCAALCWCECACGCPVTQYEMNLPCYNCGMNGGWDEWEDDDDSEED